MSKTRWFASLLVFTTSQIAIAETLYDYSFDMGYSYADRFAVNGGKLSEPLLYYGWNEIHHIPYTASLIRPFSDALDVMTEDRAQTNLSIMGHGGRGGVAKTRNPPAALGGREELTWLGWFQSDQIWQNGATMIEVPGLVSISGGSGPSFGGVAVEFFHSGAVQPVSFATQPLSISWNSDEKVMWAVTFDRNVDQGNLKVYRGTENEPMALVDQVSIVDAGNTGVPTNVMSIGNSIEMDTPFLGKIDHFRISDQALTLDDLESFRTNPLPVFVPLFPGDLSGNGFIGSEDIATQNAGWTSYLAPETGDKTWFHGDLDFDGDVDTKDRGWLLSGFGEFSYLHQPCDGGQFHPDGGKFKPKLVYDVQTGEVILDFSAAFSDCRAYTSFTIGDEQGNLIPDDLVRGNPFDKNDVGNAGPLLDVGSNTDLSPFQIGQTDPFNFGLDGQTVSLGEILPPHFAFTSLELSSKLEIARNSDIARRYTDFEVVVEGLTTGDVDFDGDVDAADRTQLTINWTGATMRGDSHKRFPEGDFDGDGDVDSLDATRMVSLWSGARQSRASSSIVPEPTSNYPLLLISLLALVRFCHEARRDPT